MKILFIGGTGNISAASSRLALQRGIELYLLNRGNRTGLGIEGAHSMVGDINNEPAMAAALADHQFDVVVDWIAYTPEQVERDIRLFRGKTRQYVFISSASVYQRPLAHPVVTESTPLCNPFWEYSRQKIACEQILNREYTENGFPICIVRPSLTYETVIPMAIGSWNDYTIVDRMKKGQQVIVHGDGTSLWTITHSQDFALGLVGLLGHQQAIGHAFHITSDEILTWNQIYEALAMAAGVEANIIHIPSDFIGRFDEFQVGNLLGDKASSTLFDNSKIKRFVPGFQATIPFHEGIRQTVRWFEEKPERMTIVDSSNQLIDRVIKAYNRALVD